MGGNAILNNAGLDSSRGFHGGKQNVKCELGKLYGKKRKLVFSESMHFYYSHYQ